MVSHVGPRHSSKRFPTIDTHPSSHTKPKFPFAGRFISHPCMVIVHRCIRKNIVVNSQNHLEQNTRNTPRKNVVLQIDQIQLCRAEDGKPRHNVAKRRRERLAPSTQKSPFERSHTITLLSLRIKTGQGRHAQPRTAESRAQSHNNVATQQEGRSFGCHATLETLV